MQSGLGTMFLDFLHQNQNLPLLWPSFWAFLSPDLSEKLICVWAHESSTGSNFIFLLQDLTQRTTCMA